MSLEIRVGLLILVGMLGLGGFIYLLATFPGQAPELSNCAECRTACAREHMIVFECSYRSTIHPFGPDCHCAEAP